MGGRACAGAAPARRPALAGARSATMYITYNGSPYLFGTADHDWIFGKADAANRLFGYGGNDYLRGGDSYDYLDGGIGNDHLEGGAGPDSIHGGDGTDSAIYEHSPAGVWVSLQS